MGDSTWSIECSSFKGTWGYLAITAGDCSEMMLPSGSVNRSAVAHGMCSISWGSSTPRSRNVSRAAATSGHSNTTVALPGWALPSPGVRASEVAAP